MLVLACCVGCAKHDGFVELPRADTSPTTAPDPESTPLASASTPTAAPDSPTPTDGPGDGALTELPDDAPDFSDGQDHPGDVLLWVHSDDLQTDETIWLAVSATGTEEVGVRPGLWLAAGDAIWQWTTTPEDLPVCALGGCLSDVPVCKKAKKTLMGLVDRVSWQALGQGAPQPVGPRLPEVAALGLGAQSLAEHWSPLALIDGQLLVRVERVWQACDGDALRQQTHLYVISPPQPTLRPLLASARTPADIVALPGGDAAVWVGMRQTVLASGRWRTDDEWAVPAVDQPAVSTPSMAVGAPVTTMTTALAALLPGDFQRRAKWTPRLRDPRPEWQPDGQGMRSRLGWSRLAVGAERRTQLRAWWTQPTRAN